MYITIVLLTFHRGNINGVSDVRKIQEKEEEEKEEEDVKVE